MSWLADVKDRFRDRTELSSTELYDQFALAGQVHQDELACAFTVFRVEFGISPGLLRGDDSLELFTQPPHTRNPLVWPFIRMEFEDRMSELNYHLKRGRKLCGASELSRPPKTVREYVLAWAGRDLLAT